MSQCKPKTLFEGGGINISTCTCCKRIGLQFKNILHGFDRSNFKHFAASVLTIDFGLSAMSFPGGQKQIVVKTCHSDVQFCFTEQEFVGLKIALEETMLMIEVHSVLETN